MFVRLVRRGAAVLLAVLLPLPALADISPGTQLTGTMDTGFNSKDAQVGDTFTVSNTRSGNIDKIVGRATNVKVDTKSNATKEIASGAGGALVGGLLGGGIGAAIGGGAGLLYSKNSKENVSIPQGSLVTVQITQARKQSR